MLAAMPDSDSQIAAKLAERERQELVRLVVVGSVDDGKSTLIGRLLYEGNGLYEDQISAVKRASKQSGLELDFSLFTDGLRAEREQGITIDVAYRYFSTAKRKYIVADTPGHQQYTRNMATGASTADVAVILIDARLGVLQQSRRHAFIASLLGIPRLAVAVNKMDLVDNSREVFERTVEAFGAFAGALGFAEVSFFPVSARAGDNVVARSERMGWYSGPSLMEFLEQVPVGRDAAARPLRFPVQLVLRPNLEYRGFAGQLSSGKVRVGDAVIALPSGQRSTVRAIDAFEGELAEAAAPQSVTLRLADEIDLSRGEMLVHEGPQPVVASELEAHLVWMGDRPLDLSRELVLKHTTRRVKARVAELHGRVELETLEETRAESLEKNDIGRVRISCQRPLFVDPYKQDRATGAFILVDALTNETVAAGMILRAIDGDRTERTEAPTGAERRARFGHGGAVIQLADEGSAARLEWALFERGFAVARVRSAEAAASVAAAGLLALHVGEVGTLAGTVVKPPANATAEDLLSELERAGVLELP